MATNVGTAGHCDYGTNVSTCDDSLHDAWVRYYSTEVCDPPPVVAVKKEPSWQSMNRGVKSKKQRRAL